MFTNALRDIWLNHFRGTQPAVLASWAGLIEVMTAYRAGTVTETAYTGYARVNLTANFTAPADTSPVGGRETDNGSLATFPQNTGSAVNLIGYGIWTASTAGTLLAIGFLDADKPLYGAVTDVELAGNTIRLPNHGLVADQRLFALAAPGAPMPAGISEDTNYFVGVTADADTIALSTTVANGAPVDITGDGALLVMPNTVVAVATNATPEFAIGAVAIQV